MSWHIRQRLDLGRPITLWNTISVASRTPDSADPCPVSSAAPEPSFLWLFLSFLTSLKLNISVLSNLFNMSIWSCPLPVQILQWCPIWYSKPNPSHGLLSLSLSAFIPMTLISFLSTPVHFLEKSQAHSHLSICSVVNHVLQQASLTS